MSRSFEQCWGQYYARWESCVGNEMEGRRQRIMGRYCCDACIATTALNDELTGLPNRYRMLGAFEEFKQSGQPFGAIALDLEHFKTVNDRLGHEKGDEILRSTAEFLKDSVRQNDNVFIGRRGGDEFALFIKLISRQGNNLKNPDGQLNKIAERIRSSYLEFDPIREYNSDPKTSDKKALGIKFGTAVWEEDMDIEALLAKADAKGNALSQRTALPSWIPGASQTNPLLDR